MKKWADCQSVMSRPMKLQPLKINSGEEGE